MLSVIDQPSLVLNRDPFIPPPLPTTYNYES